MKVVTFAHLHVLYKRVDEYQQIDEREQPYKAGDDSRHVLDSFEHVEYKVIAEDNKVHVIEIYLQIQQRVCRVVDSECDINCD